MASIARAVRIGRGQKAAEAAAAAVAPELFQQSEETALHDAYQQAAAQVGNALSEARSHGANARSSCSASTAGQAVAM